VTGCLQVFSVNTSQGYFNLSFPTSSPLGLSLPWCLFDGWQMHRQCLLWIQVTPVLFSIKFMQICTDIIYWESW